MHKFKVSEIVDLELAGAQTPDRLLGILHGTEPGPLFVGDSIKAWSVCGTLGSGTRFYPYYMSWLFEAHSLWCDGLLSLDRRRELVLPQLNVPGFVKGLNLLRSVLGGRWSGGEGEGGWTVLICKINKNREKTNKQTNTCSSPINCLSIYGWISFICWTLAW